MTYGYTMYIHYLNSEKKGNVFNKLSIMDRKYAHSNNFSEIKQPLRRSPWYNSYRRRKWTRRHEFKSWTRLTAFH